MNQIGEEARGRLNPESEGQGWPAVVYNVIGGDNPFFFFHASTYIHTHIHFIFHNQSTIPIPFFHIWLRKGQINCIDSSNW
jgi:hypothetical protein